MAKCEILSGQIHNVIELLEETIAIYLYEKQHREPLTRKCLNPNSTKKYQYLLRKPVVDNKLPGESRGVADILPIHILNRFWRAGYLRQ